jgi:hypothetical protein
MAMKKSEIASVVLAQEGPVRVRAHRIDSRSMSLEMGIDFEKAEVPDRLYYSDYCDVKRGRVGINIIFGRLEPDGNRLRTQVEIAFPEDQFVKQLWSNSRGLHETVRGHVDGRLPSKVHAEGTDKVQTFRSNNVFMAVLGDEAVMDFYYISPGDIHFVAVKKRREVHLEPVIRIAVNTAIMFEFLEACRPLAEELAPIVEKQDAK